MGMIDYPDLNDAVWYGEYLNGCTCANAYADDDDTHTSVSVWDYYWQTRELRWPRSAAFWAGAYHTLLRKEDARGGNDGQV